MNFNNMRKIKTIVTFLVVLNAICASGSDIQKYYEKLDDAFSNRSTTEIVMILSETESSEFWSFGAGLGPTNNESFQIRVTSLLFNYFGTEEGYLKNIDSGAAKSDLDENSKKWIDFFQVSPKNSDRVLFLLNSEKGALRNIGLHKVEYIDSIDKKIESALRNIFSNDPYFQIVRKPVNPKGSRPAPPGLTENEVVFPLRKFSCQLLTKFGHPCELNEMTMAKDFIEILAQMWKENPEQRTAIEIALKLLNKKEYYQKALSELEPAENMHLVYLKFSEMLDVK
ncbi:MAG: hypothetical protein JJT75_14780 [Opitutales bacterium]|nr:hypothetical protein [Opitutales bacterium]MCH8541772.1 hypothetical protein [Opitutales bacterium]